jgi:hypothetical protein
MSAKTIRNQIAELEALLDDWIRFRGIFEEHSDVAEMSQDEFLALKNQIALRQEVLMNVLEFEIEIGQMVLDIVSRVATPQYVFALSDIARKRLENEWNTAYLFVNETIGLLEKKLEHRVTATRPDQIILHFLQIINRGLVRLLQSSWFKILMFLLVVVLIIYGIFALGFLSWEDAKGYLPEFIQNL